jgi:hypothetical protein
METTEQATAVVEETTGQAQAIDFAAHEPAITEYLKGKGYEVARPSELQKGIDEAIRKAHEAWEGKLSSVLGEAKPDGVKGLEWAAGKIEALKTKPANKVENSTDQAVEQSAVKTLTEEVQALKQQIAEKERATLELEINTHIREGIAAQKLAVPGHLKGEDAEKFQATQRFALEAQLKQQFRTEKDSQGRVVFFEGENALVDPATQTPLRAEQIVKSRFGYLLEAPRPQQTGTGVKPDGSGVTGFMGSTKEAIYAEAAKQGLTTGSKEWTTAVAAAMTAAGLK